MKELLKTLTECGVSISKFSRMSEVSSPTLKRVDKGLPVREITLARVRMALDRVLAKVNTKRG